MIRDIFKGNRDVEKAAMTLVTENANLHKEVEGFMRQKMARLKEDLKADSASVMMLVMDIESEFEIEVEDDAIEKVKTVADMVKYIEEKM